MTRTVPTVPLDDERTWRRLLAAVHPDAGGSEELFVFLTAVKEAVLSGGLRELAPPEDASRPRPSPRHESRRAEGDGGDPARVPFPSHLSHADVVDAALRLAECVDEPYASLLELLADCWSNPEHGSAGDEERRGASYRRLAAIGHRVGMSGRGRSRWYEVARRVPLNDRCAAHILQRLGER
jgi:hypothetical protein